MQRIRAEASQIIATLDQGINPNREKKAFDRTLTLQEGLDNYLNQSTNTPRVIVNWRNAIEQHLSKWLNKPLAYICIPQKIYSMHRSIMQNISKENAKRGKSGDGGIGANEVMKKLRRILNFNRALTNSSELPRWPSEELGANGLKMWIEQKPRSRRVHHEEFPAFWQSLHQLECPVQRDLFKFILLTGRRSSEARSLRTEDINLRRKTVTFTNTKNGKDHTLPLTGTLFEIIRERITEANNGVIFPLAEPKTVTKHIKRACGLHITPHDLRRTFAGVAEAAGVGSTTKKDLLNHLSGKDVTDDYTGSTDLDGLKQALQDIEHTIILISSTRDENCQRV